MYEVGHTLKNIRKLPLNLLDALRAFAGSAMLRDRLGAGFVDSYLKLRMADWHDYTRHLTEWERERTLDV
jgi:glutamine synthetase